MSLRYVYGVGVTFMMLDLLPSFRWLDQEAHNFTHLAYILLIVIAAGGLNI